MKLFFIFFLLSLTLNSCSLKNSIPNAFKIEKVEPWQRDILSDKSMQLDPDSMQSYANDHIYFSRESASGGRGAGGGGCGCN